MFRVCALAILIKNGISLFYQGVCGFFPMCDLFSSTGIHLYKYKQCILHLS